MRMNKHRWTRAAVSAAVASSMLLAAALAMAAESASYRMDKASVQPISATMEAGGLRMTLVGGSGEAMGRSTSGTEVLDAGPLVAQGVQGVPPDPIFADGFEGQD